MSRDIRRFVGLREVGGVHKHNVLRLPPAVVELSFIGPRASGALVKPRRSSSVIKKYYLRHAYNVLRKTRYAQRTTSAACRS